ncbi:phosphate ABC transporter substrate-binding protein [Fibrobacterota bacterium]
MKKLLAVSAVTLVFIIAVFATSRQLTIKGSDTMVHLASIWAENHMKDNRGPQISVTGGGSGTGIAALLNGTTDICAASRKIKEKEIKLAEKKGIKPVEHVVARDGIAVVINPGNQVDELTIEQIGKIYTGAITNWKQVGGPDQKIIVFSRESSSGTYVFFQKKVLNKQDYTPKARLMPATSAIIKAASEDKWSIGYVGLGYAVKAGGKVKVLKVKSGPDSPAVSPSEATVVDGSYSIARPLHLYTKGEPEGEVKKFLDYCFSPEGQKVVRETGYVPVK